MSVHSARAARALAILAEADPALGALSLWCAHRDGEGETRTEGETILYGPAFALLAPSEQAGLAARHVLHVALRHSFRMAAEAARLGPAFDPGLWALAAEALANEAARAGGHAPPRPAPGLADLLPKEKPAPVLAEWDVEKLYARLRAEGRKGGEGRRTLAPAPGGEGEDKGAADWRGRLTRAVEAGRIAGRGIGRHAAFLAALPLSRTPWEVVLRRLLAKALSETPRLTHARPTRRWPAMEAEARRSGGPEPAFEPARLMDARRPRIAVGLDTSGSVTDDDLALLAGELAGIARRTGAEIHALAFDETVHWEARPEPGRLDAALRAAPLRRGGGTAFLDVVDRAAALDASAAVILTDLDGAFGKPPRLPVIWAVREHPAKPPPFGKVLEIG
ncbi:MAG: DUF2201 family putative metallopeptidase [Pikeienuella sp.]|uniref:vWA domain-containing protein n=1 Tax=Pikeienuella sp. TaxID=2831957 RepID=UPI003918854E